MMVKKITRYYFLKKTPRLLGVYLHGSIRLALDSS